MSQPKTDAPAEPWGRLRTPFPAETVGKLPRVTCRACSESRSRVCSEHSKSRCQHCHNWITSAHIDLDYVGHAAVTDRLLSVDPQWTWEPMAFDAEGLPALDRNGGLWIRLTVSGSTKIGYGNAPGKNGGDAVKEVIGDAIRNAAMRFGVALDLWSKEDLKVTEANESPAERTAPPAAKKAAAKKAAAAANEGPQTDEEWEQLARGAGDELELRRLATACNVAGRFQGNVQKVFTTRREELTGQQQEATAS